mmetsp:Transcript_124380/g.359647  ORF Transcript_124380/g.359647 Transcript_124380/m.359647 type:complete len:294 (+) Transcript_124380:602-1483(+)
MGAGGLFGPLQKISPSEVLWSRGKVWSNCAMLSWNFSRNSSSAHRTQASKGASPSRSKSARLMAPSRLNCDVALPSALTFCKSAPGSSKKLFTSFGPSAKSCSKRSRDHSMVCSIAFGKCFNVHSGIDSSGGSCESPYDCVRCGRTTCALALVPNVPDSSKGLQNQTHRESTYMRAWTLSKAFTTQSKPDQNKSSNGPSSVSGPTRCSSASTFSAEFIRRTASAAVVDFEWPTSRCRNKNCRFRFDTSMRSMSVTTTLPPGPQQAPNIAKHLRYSQPSAPAPTRNNLSSPSLR